MAVSANQFDPTYARERAFTGLAPPTPVPTVLGFRALMHNLTLPPGAKAVEVGGHTGDHTTIHILEVAKVPVDILEIDKERAEALQRKFNQDSRFAGQVHVHATDARLFQTPNKYELAILDLPTGVIPVQFEDIFPKVEHLIATQGTVILYVIYDIEAAYDVPDPPGHRTEQERFMRSYFGSTRIDVEAANKVMWPKGYTVLGLVDRWMLGGNRKGHGWLCLERLPQQG